MLQVKAIKGPTGRLLKEMLDEKGLLDGHVKGVVNYGCFGQDPNLPTLNAKAGGQDKYKELVLLKEAGIPTVPFSRSAAELDVPMFGRKFHHTRGTDIFVYKVRPLLRGDHLSDFYTQIVSKQNEFRVWAFRDKFLAAYEKKLNYPAKYGKRGRSKDVWNWSNGFAYEFVEQGGVSRGLKNIAIDSVESLGLDFGAVDVLLGADRKLRVLEVNTAPGVQDRRQGFCSLVNCIEKWAKGGFKERSEGPYVD